MSEHGYIVRIGEVTKVDDPYNAGRVVVAFPNDKIKNSDEYDANLEPQRGEWAWPLLPKMLHVLPKVGEYVLVISSRENNKNSDRFYVGPVISQPQFMMKDPYQNGDRVTNMIQGGTLKPEESIETISGVSAGAYPDVQDISIVGRKSEDITIKEGEIDLRCGVRGLALNDYDTQGYVVFNQKDPTYIQLKNDMAGEGSVNIVSDEIHIMSHKGVTKLNSSPEITGQKDLISKDDMVKLKNELHKVPYGDLLLRYLENIRQAMVTHVHPIGGMPPCEDASIINMIGDDYRQMLSDTLKIT